MDFPRPCFSGDCCCLSILMHLNMYFMHVSSLFIYLNLRLDWGTEIEILYVFAI